MSCDNHLHRIGGICCQKIIPLVFDQSYSYYEQLCAFLNKLNELVDAVNLQNLTISEFENEINELFNQFKNEMRLAFADFQIEMRQEFENFTTQITTEWNAYKADLTAQWENEKAINTAFRADMQSAWTTYQTELNASFEIFKSQETAARQTFETSITTRQTNFENSETAARTAFQQGMTQGFNAFTTSITNQQNGFESSMTQRADDFESSIENEIAALDLGEDNCTTQAIPAAFTFGETDPERITVAGAVNYINNSMSGDLYCRVYRESGGTVSFIKRLLFAEIATNSAIPDATVNEPLIIIFENPVINSMIYPLGDIAVTGTQNATSAQGFIIAYNFETIPKLNSDAKPDFSNANCHQIGYGSGRTSITCQIDTIYSYSHFLVLRVTNVQKNFLFTRTNPNFETSIAVREGYIYDSNRNCLVRDPKINQVESKINSSYIYQIAGGTSTKTITLDPSAAYVVFLAFGSSCNVYFLNSTTVRAYIKTVVDQMNEDITATYTDLSVTFTSTAGNAFTLFAKRISV